METVREDPGDVLNMSDPEDPTVLGRQFEHFQVCQRRTTAAREDQPKWRPIPALEAMPSTAPAPAFLRFDQWRASSIPELGF